ncbi:MAG: hypothetical protein NWS09_04045, partial [Schleiferiaceae bacterium]|nr:hypothetical protein [Schleiferiaceae bacterium]
MLRRILWLILLAIGPLAYGQNSGDSTRHVRLDDILVVAEPVDMAYDVLREAGRRAKGLPSFQCSTAVKSSVGLGRGIQLREALSLSFFAAPARYSERIYLADEHTTSGGLSDGRSVQVQFNVGRDEGAAPKETFQALGKHFFESYPDGHLDLYTPSIELPRLMSARIPSPLAADAALQYKARVVQAQAVDGSVLWTIAIEPRGAAGAGLRGTLVIDDSTYTLVSADVELPAESLARFRSARVRQAYA